MAKNVKMEWYDEGFKEILLSDELAKVVWNAGKKIANAAGDEFDSKNGYYVIAGANRPTALIHAVSPEGFQKEATDKVLEKAVAKCQSN